MRTVPARLLPLLLALAGCEPLAPPGFAKGPYAVPIEGTFDETIFHGSLVDHDAGGGLEDYDCLKKTYDGHRGTDIILPSFRDMDRGVAVYAAAAGEVVYAWDAEPDRNVERGDRPGNEVIVRHGDGRQTIYAHLRQGSATVEVGDQVAGGDVLGLVGSSGDSNWPHLHFEVVDVDGEAMLDPWEGRCGADASLWTDQVAYPNRFVVIDKSTTDAPATVAALAERPPDVTSFPADAAGVTFWVHVSNRPAGELKIRVIAPGGVVTDSNALSYADPASSTSLLGGFLPLEGQLGTGTWAFELLMNDDVFATLPFTVTPPAGDAAAGAAGRGDGRGAAGPLPPRWPELLDHGTGHASGASR